MATSYKVASCSECGFPISGKAGEQISCPNCGISGKISGIEIPTTLFWSGIAFFAGVILSPYLKKKAAKYVT